MFNSRSSQHGLIALVAAAGLAGTAGAQMTPHFGYDFFAGSQSAPRPNSLAAESAWAAAASSLSATGMVQCVDMQNLALNAVLPLNVPTAIWPGVTFQPNAPAWPAVVLGGATESLPGGFDTSPATPLPFDAGQRISLVGPFISSVTSLTYDIVFTPPVQAFGMWVTGEGNTVSGGTMFLTFQDSNAGWMIPMSGTIGAQFVGFTDPGQAISTVSLVLPGNSGALAQPFISVDDICFVLSIPGGCDPDYDHDGFLTGDDFDAFLVDFEIGSPNADYTGDGFVTGEDFDQFVVDFEKGC